MYNTKFTQQLVLLLCENRKQMEEKYPVEGRWSAQSALAIEVGWLSKGEMEWGFDREIIYSREAPMGHLPTLGRQELGVAFHHGYTLTWIFSKLYGTSRHSLFYT